MLRKTTLFAAIAVSFLSTPAHAEEHIILIMPDAYFPAKSYVTAGDTLKFVNETSGTINVVSGNDGWSTGNLGINQYATVSVSQGMNTGFYHEGVYDDNGDPAITGILQFGAAPLN